MKLLALHVTTHEKTVVVFAVVQSGFNATIIRRVGADGVDDATERRKVVEALAEDLQSLEIDCTDEDVERAL